MELIFLNKNKILNLLLILALTVTVIGLFVDVTNTIMFWGTDLRTRVIGARLLIEGMDPYFFQWYQGLSERFFDPLVHPKSITTRVTVPPTILLLHSIMARLPYLTQKVLWLIVQWGAFSFALSIFTSKNDSAIKRNLILILGCFFFNSYFWRIHVQAGQIYILYVALLTLAWFLLNQSFKYKNIVSGFVAGLTASLRLPSILIFFPFLIYRKWSFLFGGMLGLLSGLFCSFALVKVSVWKSYFLAMSVITQVINLEKLPTPLKTADVAKQSYPEVVEGISTLKLDTEFTLSGSDSSLVYFIESINKVLGINISPSYILIASWLVIFSFISVYLLKLSHKRVAINLVFLLGLVIYLVSEFFIPITRYSYNDVQWILPLSILISESNILELFTGRLIVLLFVSLLFSIGCLSWIPRFFLINSILMALYVMLASLSLVRKNVENRK